MVIDRIARNAEGFSPGPSGTRWARVQPFNYLLHFRIVDENRVRVLAVSHGSRRPGYWVHRIRRP
jgi:plasmid stabilization system protein ParE